MANRIANGMPIKTVIKSKCALTNPWRELCNYFNCLMSKGEQHDQPFVVVSGGL